MRRFVPKFHGGPELKTKTSKRSARNRGLRQQEPNAPCAPVKVIVRNGQVLMPNALRKLNLEVPIAPARPGRQGAGSQD